MILNHFGAPLSFGYICLLVLLFVAVASFVDVNGTMITIDEYEGGEIDGRQLYMNQIVWVNFQKKGQKFAAIFADEWKNKINFTLKFTNEKICL